MMYALKCEKLYMGERTTEFGLYSLLDPTKQEVSSLKPKEYKGLPIIVGAYNRAESAGSLGKVIGDEIVNEEMNSDKLKTRRFDVVNISCERPENFPEITTIGKNVLRYQSMISEEKDQFITALMDTLEGK